MAVVHEDRVLRDERCGVWRRVRQPIDPARPDRVLDRIGRRDEVERAIRTKTNQVASPVKAIVRIVSKWTANEFLSGQFR